VMHDGMQYDPM